MVKLVIFDFDGVIYNSKKEVYKVVKRYSKRFGFRMGNIRDFEDFYEDNFYVAVVKRGMKKSSMSKFVKVMKAWLVKNYRPPVFRRMIPVLKRLCNRYHFAIESSNFSLVMKSLLKRDKIDNYFDHVIGADTEKSKTRHLSMLLRRHLISPEDAVFVTDTVGDVKEAKKTGIPVIGVTWGFHDAKRMIKARPDKIVKTPLELSRLLEKIHG